MALDQKFFKKSTAAGSGAANQEQGLFIYADANDVDSYDGDGDIWYDINAHEVNIPLADKSSNLVLNLDGGTYTSGAWEDQSTNTNNASLNGNATYNSDTKGYFTLDGSGDYLQISDNSSLNLAGGGATYEIWFRQHVLAGSEHLFGRYETGGNFDFFISTGSSGAISLHFYDGSSSVGNINSGGSKYTANTWHHVAVTLSSGSTGGTIKLYIDGNLEGSTTLSGNRVADPTADLYLGRLGSGHAYELDGDIGTTRIYNVALTASEVAQNFRAGNNLNYSSIITSTDILADFRPSNYSSGTTWNDSSTNSNNATLNNFSSTVADYYDEEIGNFFHLDGSNDYFSTSITKNWASIAWSVEMWFNTDTRNDRYLWGMSDSVGYGVNVSLRGSGNSYNILLIGVGLLSAGVYEAGRWYHLVYTSDGTTKKAYLNGLFVGSTTATIDSRANGKPFTFGRYGSVNTGYYDGKIGHTRVYENTLTAEQVAQNYLATKNKYPNGNNFSLLSSPAFQNSSTPYYFRFDAGADKAEVTSVDINVSTGFTVSIYIKRHATTSGYQHCFRLTGAGYTNYLFAIFSHNDQVYYDSAGTGNTFSTFNLGLGNDDWTDNSGAWRNVIFTRENTPGSTTNRGEVYENGVSLRTQTNLSAITNITNIYVNRNASSDAQTAKVDVGLIKIWQKPFSDAEALAEYNATKSIYGL